jgi:hypothetical protein
MSAALTCTRATAPRALLHTRRFASTDATVLTLRPKTPASPTATTPTKPKRTTAPTLAERMHRALYPEMYPGGRPVGVDAPKRPKDVMSGVKSRLAPALCTRDNC